MLLRRFITGVYGVIQVKRKLFRNEAQKWTRGKKTTST